MRSCLGPWLHVVSLSAIWLLLLLVLVDIKSCYGFSSAVPSLKIQKSVTHHRVSMKLFSLEDQAVDTQQQEYEPLTSTFSEQVRHELHRNQALASFSPSSSTSSSSTSVTPPVSPLLAVQAQDQPSQSSLGASFFVSTAVVAAAFGWWSTQYLLLHHPPSMQLHYDVVHPVAKAMSILIDKRTLLSISTVMSTSLSSLSSFLPLPQLQQGWNAYQQALLSNPILTKAATSATVYSIGDIVAQQLGSTSTTTGNDVTLESQESYSAKLSSSSSFMDWKRVGISFIAGGIGHGPLSHVWYNVSEAFFHNILHWDAWWSFVPKIVIDQTVWGPIWTVIYLTLLGGMNQQSLSDIRTNIQSSIGPLFVDGLKLWPLAHCVTYGLIPVENRLLWVDLVEILWVTILAQQAAKATTNTLSAPASSSSASHETMVSEMDALTTPSR